MSNTLSLAFTANFSATVFTDAGTVDFTNAILSVDTDGNSAADMDVQFTGLIAFDQLDFILV